MVHVEKRDVEVHKERYCFSADNDEWKIVYSVFSYSCETDRSDGDVDESLEFRRACLDENFGLHHEKIYSCYGEIGLETGKHFSFSPVLEAFNKLESKVVKEVVGNFSTRALRLFTRGFNKYLEHQNHINS